MDPPISFRKPQAGDGPAVFDLIAVCPPLDPNSRYCNLLQCTHFSDTCLLAERNGKISGFVSGYRLPRQPATLFVWQVAVASFERGQGLARRMLIALLQNLSRQGVDSLETTITPDNKASWKLFRSLAEELEADFQHNVFLQRDAHFSGHHDEEHLVRICAFENLSMEKPKEKT